MASRTVIINGDSWEGNDTWPSVNKVFNVTAFNNPEKRFSSAAFSPAERSNEYRKHGAGITALQRGAPQLAWFEGSYDLYAHEGEYPTKCAYPKVVGPTQAGGKRMCLDPGKLTPAELEALRKEQIEAEAAFASGLKKYLDQDTHPCNTTYGIYDSKTGKLTGTSKATEYVKLIDSDNQQHYYSCPAPGKFLRKQRPALVRGLGESELEKTEIAKTNKSYRMTEFALVGFFAVGLYLVWKK